jgi:large subunit ribosomal protein L29
MAKRTDYRDLGDAELYTQLADAKQELFNLRFQNVTGQLDNPTRISQAKRQVARLFTEIRAREIAAAEALVSAEEGN